MDINEMEETGVYDYYDALNRWINYFVNRNYPLKEDDFRAIAQGNTTENITNREKVVSILKNELENQLSKQQEINANMLKDMENGTYTPYDTDCLNRDIEKMQQEMLEKLWNEQHPEIESSNPEQSVDISSGDIEESNEIESESESQEDYSDNSLIDQVSEISEEMDIRADEISEANVEINNIERDFIQQQQLPQQDMSIGE